ncbi:hypothetical protein [Chitinophaga flava]|uniref:hypothetical protein n=1 Tax=Chitinophaga flava TaxID=2259036 RepID=UPI0011BE1EFD|nr:hypothetical protein [Chitinophaga flava]
MKRIKIAFAALSAVAGIGGAYATTHQGESSRIAQTYTWRTVVQPSNNITLYTHTTVATAKVLSGCTGSTLVPCLRGTSPGVPVFTLYKP